MLMDALDRQFLKHGWLMPALFPLAQVGGRGLFNSLAGIYVLWGLLVLLRHPPRWSRVSAAAYGLLLVAFLASVLQAPDRADSFKNWLVYALHTLAFPLTLMALQRVPEAGSRLLAAWGASGLALVLLLYLLLPLQMAEPGFQPTQHMKEDNLPFLTPLVLLWLASLPRAGLRRVAQVTLFLLVLGYIVFSQGRAALAALGVMSVVYLMLGMRWRSGRAVMVAGAVVLAGVVLSGQGFFRALHLGDGSDGWVTLDRFTSGRTQIWRQAVAHPPESLAFGVGMGQIGYSREALEVAPGHAVGHLHNFLMDAWYETGWFGLLSLLGFVGVGIVHGLRAVRFGNERQRRLAAALLAAVAALLVAALFSFSYASRQLSLYMFVLLGALEYLCLETRLGVARGRGVATAGGE